MPKQSLVSAFLLLVIVNCMGCGHAAYEERLNQTVDFYKYLNEINEKLASPAWQRTDVGMGMRVPLPFRAPMAGPEVVTDNDGNQYYGPDPRQPDVLGSDLTGIVDAFQAPIPVDSGETVNALFYVLSNHERYLAESENTPDPSEYLSDLETLLMYAFGVSIPDGESTQPMENMRYRKLYPERNSDNAKYIVPKDYMIIEYVPTELVGGRDLQGWLFERREGDIQAAVLVIVPKSISRNFRSSLELALQTWQIDGRKPVSTPGGGGRAGGGGGTGF